MKIGDRVEVIEDFGDRTKRTLIGRVGTFSAGPFEPHDPERVDTHGPTCIVDFDEDVYPFGRQWHFPVSFLRIVDPEGRGLSAASPACATGKPSGVTGATLGEGREG